MVPNITQNPEAQLAAALASTRTSVRLSNALAAGSRPRPEYVGHLIAQCAVESDFFVRDMLTWALLQHDRTIVLPGVLAELSSEVPQARSQALHTLAKIGDPATWPAITPNLLFDADDEVARAAWRAASGLVPPGHEARLAADLATQFGRGGPEVMLSLSRALLTLGDAALPVVAQASRSSDEAVRAHALLTERLRKDPSAGFEESVENAKRARALHGAPLVGE